MSKDRPFFKLYTTKFVMDMASLDPVEFKDRMMGAVSMWIDGDFESAPSWLLLANSDAERISKQQSERRKGKTANDHGEPRLTGDDHGEPRPISSSLSLSSPSITTTLPYEAPKGSGEGAGRGEGANMDALVDRLTQARPIYGTRKSVTRALAEVVTQPDWDPELAVKCLRTREAYEAAKNIAQMKLETLLSNDGWKVDWEARLSEEGRWWDD